MTERAVLQVDGERGGRRPSSEAGARLRLNAAFLLVYGVGCYWLLAGLAGLPAAVAEVGGRVPAPTVWAAWLVAGARTSPGVCVLIAGAAAGLPLVNARRLVRFYASREWVMAFFAAALLLIMAAVTFGVMVPLSQAAVEQSRTASRPCS